MTGRNGRTTRGVLSIRNLLLVLAGAIYLGIGYVATTMPHPPLVTILVGLAPLAVAALVTAWKARARMLFMSLYIVCAMTIVLNLHQLRDHAAWVYFIQHAGAMSLLAIIFGSTLGNGEAGALCSRIASFIIPESLDSAYLRYTWKVTLVWTIYFAATAVLSVLLFFLAPIRAWWAFANLLTPVSLAIMFAGEYLIRLRALPDGPRISVGATIRAYREYAQRQNTH